MEYVGDLGGGVSGMLRVHQGFGGAAETGILKGDKGFAFERKEEIEFL